MLEPACASACLLPPPPVPAPCQHFISRCIFFSWSWKRPNAAFISNEEKMWGCLTWNKPTVCCLGEASGWAWCLDCSSEDGEVGLCSSHGAIRARSGVCSGLVLLPQLWAWSSFHAVLVMLYSSSWSLISLFVKPSAPSWPGCVSARPRGTALTGELVMGLLARHTPGLARGLVGHRSVPVAVSSIAAQT